MLNLLYFRNSETTDSMAHPVTIVVSTQSPSEDDLPFNLSVDLVANIIRSTDDSNGNATLWESNWEPISSRSPFVWIFNVDGEKDAQRGKVLSVEVRAPNSDDVCGMVSIQPLRYARNYSIY